MNTPENHLLALEAERARCLQSDDIDGLRQLLSERLIHVHTRGKADDRDGYLRFVQTVAQVLELRRGTLTVQMLGNDAALMTGTQTNRSRGRAKGDEVTTEALITQVWAREADGVWRQLAFHGTAVPAAA